MALVQKLIEITTVIMFLIVSDDSNYENKKQKNNP